MQSKPTAVEEMRRLGYEVRGKRLVQVDSGKPFEFVDQDHYDRLADAVLSHVGTMLVEVGGLQPISLPLGGDQRGPHCLIYASEGFRSAEKLLVMLQGSGRVRVGVWGCALCINKDFDEGTMLPYIEAARRDGYGIIILNPNENMVGSEEVPGSETPLKHVAYAFEHVILGECNPTQVDVVAHSNGGRVLLYFLAMAGDSAPPNAAAVAKKASTLIRRVVFTDSYHFEGELRLSTPETREMLADASRAINYVPHEAPLGTAVDRWTSLGNPMSARQKGCACVSAGVLDHAATNHAALAAAFEFFRAP